MNKPKNTDGFFEPEKSGKQQLTHDLIGFTVPNSQSWKRKKSLFYA